MMRKFIAGLAALGLSVTLSTPMAAFATAHKTVQSSTIVKHVTLTPIWKNHVRGKATVTIDSTSKTLTVVISVAGLTPKSVHANYIHVDGATSNKYSLKALVANGKGDATATSVIHNITSLGKHPWVIIDQGPNMNTPVNASAIAQGAVK